MNLPEASTGLNIFVDESGTFVLSNRKNAFCVVAAYVVPGRQLEEVAGLVTALRTKSGAGAETKLRDLPDEGYAAFLDQLRGLDGLAFAVAVDVGLHRGRQIEHHRNMQAQKIRQNAPRMLYEEGRAAVTALADGIEKLPLQLYTQLVCQVGLFHTILTRALVYYVQRDPCTLAAFRWRVDRKAQSPTKYERAFKEILAGLLQSRSLQDPMIMLEGADYSYFRRFEYEDGQAPEYLQREYGLSINSGTNLGKILHEDFQFVDSDCSAGIQVADLVAGGVRRLLRGGFEQPGRIARALGCNMLQREHNAPPIALVSLDRTGYVNQPISQLLRMMSAYTRPMLAPGFGR
ncbi:DUF3800 domain-containing protein [Paraburkholderia sp. BR14263]|uniref:DUF3800 domain-containing protein n=1 Tax=unclassified Paraburkholderia TaxID=2615204 RepID=UPI0034CFEF07